MAINVDEYLNVYGDNLEYDKDFLQLQRDIKGKAEDQFGSQAEPPNWREIKKQSEALLKRSIDLTVAIYYLQSLIGLQGLSGLEDGLKLISTLVEKRWDNLYPQLDPDDDNDPTERSNILGTLCDFDTILKPLQQVTVLESQSFGKLNFRQISIALGKTTATATEENLGQKTIDAAIQDIETEKLQQTLQIVVASLENLNQLDAALNNYMSSSVAPSFSKLTDFLKEVKGFLVNALSGKIVPDPSPPDPISDPVPNPIPDPKLKQSIAGAINSDQDVIKVLNLVCDYYKKQEPSSPVPLLITRAIKLVGKNFMEVLNELAPDGVNQATTIFGRQEESEDY